jgi:hypothetical protein
MTRVTLRHKVKPVKRELSPRNRQPARSRRSRSRFERRQTFVSGAKPTASARPSTSPGEGGGEGFFSAGGVWQPSLPLLILRSEFGFWNLPDSCFIPHAAPRRGALRSRDTPCRFRWWNPWNSTRLGARTPDRTRSETNSSARRRCARLETQRRSAGPRPAAVRLQPRPGGSHTLLLEQFPIPSMTKATSRTHGPIVNETGSV